MMFMHKNGSNNFFAFVFLFFSLILLDQGAKQLATNIFLNGNFAFSLSLPLWLMYVIYFVVICWLIYYFGKNFYKISFVSRLAFILILAGAFSNVGERLVFGHVRDFIFITLGGLTGIYNLADGYIILGIILLLCYGLTTKDQELK